ncbi:MAG TPA: MBL fold metallo-hydrolase [Isosphaeraceae bacterium]|nr:MBL fold metallo-hydrolase [Isosphaeraceae bacterium]
MERPICQTCGTQFATGGAPPQICPICEDERQYVGWDGQQWTSLENLRNGHRNTVQDEEPNLWSIHTEPSFAIGQRALLIRSEAGNVLWDCLSLVDDQTVQSIEKRGGLSAIAISHPHFYTSMVEWSRAFGGVPIYLHAHDQQWVMRPDQAVHYWSGETQSLLDGLTLVRCGGHFSGSAVLHWREGAEGRGVLLTGDTIQVVMDRRHVSFMRSYPNFLPLPGDSVRAIAHAVESLEFDRIYGMKPGLTIREGGKNAMADSVRRYLLAIEGE